MCYANYTLQLRYKYKHIQQIYIIYAVLYDYYNNTTCVFITKYKYFQGILKAGDMFTFLISSYSVHKYIVVLLYSQSEKLKSNSQKNKIHNHIKFQKNTHILTKNYSIFPFGQISIKY